MHINPDTTILSVSDFLKTKYIILLADEKLEPPSGASVWQYAQEAFNRIFYKNSEIEYILFLDPEAHMRYGYDNKFTMLDYFYKKLLTYRKNLRHPVSIIGGIAEKRDKINDIYWKTALEYQPFGLTRLVQHSSALVCYLGWEEFYHSRAVSIAIKEMIPVDNLYFNCTPFCINPLLPLIHEDDPMPLSPYRVQLAMQARSVTESQLRFMLNAAPLALETFLAFGRPCFLSEMCQIAVFLETPLRWLIGEGSDVCPQAIHITPEDKSGLLARCHSMRKWEEKISQTKCLDGLEQYYQEKKYLFNILKKCGLYERENL